MTTDTTPDDAAIHAMDGQALTSLAYELGLAPQNACRNFEPRVFIREEGGMRRWTPAEDIQQAETLLRQMRILGLWAANEGAIDAGVVTLTYTRQGTSMSWKRWWSIEPRPSAEPSECLAILRCCCLARAAQMRKEVA